MRIIFTRTFLLSTILLTAPFSELSAQDTEEPQVAVAPAILLNDLTSDDEDLATESGSGPSPGPLPVDGGISLLLAAGALYGVRRVRRIETRD